MSDIGIFLQYGIECLTWFPAGCVARWPDSVRRSFMYPSLVVGGEDFVVVADGSASTSQD